MVFQLLCLVGHAAPSALKSVLGFRVALECEPFLLPFPSWWQGGVSVTSLIPLGLYKLAG